MDEVGHENAVKPNSVIVIAAALMAVGLVMIASATASLDRSLFTPPFTEGVFGRQVVFVLVGLGLMILTSRLAVSPLGSQALRFRLSRVLFIVVLGCLVVALIPAFASPHHGSHRWLHFTPFATAIRFQPSELAKFALVGLLAAHLADGGTDPRSFRRSFLPAAGAIGVCCLLIGKEDFGTAVLVGAVGALTLFVAGCKLRHLLLMGSIGLCGFTVLLVTAPYRMARLIAFKDIWADPRGASYQPLQSLTAIASGGWFGVGLGGGVQKYGYLPESHSDFIFSVICEETGFVGAGLVIALFGVLVWLGLRTMWYAITPFERLLAFGVTAMLGLQAVMNIAVATVVTPTTGIPLPLVSAGGSGMVTSCLAIGVLAAIAARSAAYGNACNAIDVSGSYSRW